MFYSQLETIKFAVFDSFWWIGSLLEYLTLIIYGSLFGVSVVMLFLIAIILGLIASFTVTDVASSGSSNIFGGSKKNKRMSKR